MVAATGLVLGSSGELVGAAGPEGTAGFALAGHRRAFEAFASAAAAVVGIAAVAEAEILEVAVLRILVVSWAECFGCRLVVAGCIATGSVASAEDFLGKQAHLCSWEHSQTAVAGQPFDDFRLGLIFDWSYYFRRESHNSPFYLAAPEGLSFCCLLYPTI